MTVLTPLQFSNCLLNYFLRILPASDSRENDFSSRVQKSVAPALWDMGILIHKFLIRDVVKGEDKDRVNGNMDA